MPNFVADRGGKQKLKTIKDLYNEIAKLEHLVYKKHLKTKKNKNHTRKEEIEEISCEICKNKVKVLCFYLEAECWFKEKEDKIKLVNNSILKVELNKDDPNN